MKKVFLAFFATSLFLVSSASYGQSIDELLNKATSIVNSSGSTKQLGDVLGSAGKLLQNELKGSDNEIKGKILEQASGLQSLVPSLLSGKANLSSVGGIINKIKLLLAANRLKSALSGGKSGLASNAGAITSALNLMKGGAAGLGEATPKGFDKLIGSAMKSTSKLGTGMFQGLKAKGTEKKLNKLVSMVTSAL